MVKPQSLSLSARHSRNGWHSASPVTTAATGNSLYFLSKVQIVSLESSSLLVFFSQLFYFLGRLVSLELSLNTNHSLSLSPEKY